MVLVGGVIGGAIAWGVATAKLKNLAVQWQDLKAGLKKRIESSTAEATSLSNEFDATKVNLQTQTKRADRAEKECDQLKAKQADNEDAVKQAHKARDVANERIAELTKTNEALLEDLKTATHKRNHRLAGTHPGGQPRDYPYQ